MTKRDQAALADTACSSSSSSTMETQRAQKKPRLDENGFRPDEDEFFDFESECDGSDDDDDDDDDAACKSALEKEMKNYFFIAIGGAKMGGGDEEKSTKQTLLVKTLTLLARWDLPMVVDWFKRASTEKKREVCLEWRKLPSAEQNAHYIQSCIFSELCSTKK